MISLLKDIQKDEGIHCGDPLYSLDEIKRVADEVREVTEDNVLALKFEKDNDGRLYGLTYALFSYAMRIDIKVRVALVFHGNGTTAPLYEMRHTWWGSSEDQDSKGYTFYLPGKAVIKALEHLQNYFDMD